MRIPPLVPRLLATACLIAFPLAARATKLTIDSAETNSTWATAQVSDRQLSWSPKDHALLAVVTFEDILHRDSTMESAHDDLYFTFPGTQLNPEDHTVFVDSPDGPIAIGLWRKGTFSSSFSLFQNTVIIVHKTHSDITLTLDIDTERNAATERKKQEATETESFPLDADLPKKAPDQ